MVSLFVPVANRFLRPRTNTDWRYAAKLLPLLSTYCSDLSISPQTNLLADAIINYRYGLASARALPVLHRIPPRWTYSLEEDTPVFESDIRGRGFDAILAYERFPSRSGGLPIAWITAPIDVERQKLEGASARDARMHHEWKIARAAQAATLIFTTQASLDRFVEQGSETIRSKSVVIPFFLPGLQAAAQISDKWTSGNLRLLFVGRQANRKGLIPALEAVAPLLKTDPTISFTIISRFVDGQVTIPSLPNLKVLPEASREDVLDHLMQSHLLVMPSSWESYGFVYIEAMSRGCVPLALDRPVQRELLGENGILVPSQNPEEIRCAIADAIKDRDRLYRKALGGLQDFKDRHSPEAVAQRFYRTFLNLKLPAQAKD